MNGPLVGLILGASAGIIFDIFLLVSLYQLKGSLPDSLLAIRSTIGTGRLMVPVTLFAHAIWTLLGVVLGFIYAWVESAGGSSGLGSSSLGFTILILVIAAAITATCLVWYRTYWVWVAPIPILLVGLFGWGLPIFLAG